MRPRHERCPPLTAAVTRRTGLVRLAGVGALALLGATLPGCERERRAAQPVPAGATVLALGDSLTYGTGASADTAYPAVLAGLTGWHVVNAGVPGDISVQALARLPALLAEHSPTLIIVSCHMPRVRLRPPSPDSTSDSSVSCSSGLRRRSCAPSGVRDLLVAVGDVAIDGSVLDQGSISSV